MGTFSQTVCFFMHCISSSRAFRIKNGYNHPPFDIVQVLSLSDRIQLLHNLSAFTAPTAPLQYLGRQVDGPGLCSTRQVHHGGCVPYVANLLPKTLADLGVQILSTCGSLHPSGKMWAVREELTRPPSRLSLASPSAWKTSCLHSKRIMHGRESCDVSPLRSSRNQTPLLICSW